MASYYLAAIIADSRRAVWRNVTKTSVQTAAPDFPEDDADFYRLHLRRAITPRPDWMLAADNVPRGEVVTVIDLQPGEGSTGAEYEGRWVACKEVSA